MANITLHDVAKVAGVSHTTVSWALRADKRITEKTRAHVQAAAQALGYIPNAVARSLATGRTHTVAIVSPAFSSAFATEILRGIEAEMADQHADFSLVQYSTGASVGRAHQVYEQIVSGNRADAVICLADPPDLPIRQACAASGKALVVFDESIDDTASIRGDNYQGAILATEHLLQSGCKRPGIVASQILASGRTKCDPDRAANFMRICAARGIAGKSMSLNHFDFDAGHKLAQAIVDEQWDGVFCAAGDMVAIGIMAACRDLGVSIPGDLRVVGYDNLLIAAMVHPALTTIAQPLELMGRTAVRSCFEQMTSGPEKVDVQHATFAPRLICRSSA
jgi:LacI family transcriptional regulator